MEQMFFATQNICLTLKYFRKDHPDFRCPFGCFSMPHFCQCILFSWSE